MTRIVTNVVVAAVIALAGTVVSACSDGDDTPSPGGINGPARVEPNGGADIQVDDD